MLNIPPNKEPFVSTVDYFALAQTKLKRDVGVPLWADADYRAPRYCSIGGEGGEEAQAYHWARSFEAAQEVFTHCHVNFLSLGWTLRGDYTGDDLLACLKPQPSLRPKDGMLVHCRYPELQ